MKYIKKYESEVSSGNASGKAGVTSLPFGKGFYQSGNTGEPGIAFTSSSEPTFGSYKKMKHSKKNLLKKLKKQKMLRIKNFENWTTNVTDNYIVNYNDKTPEKSEIVNYTINFIESNFDNIPNDVNSISINSIHFRKDDIDYKNIRLIKDTDDNVPKVISFSGDYGGYSVILTDDEYEQLSDYFKKIYIKKSKIISEKGKENYFNRLIQDKAKKYNM